MASVDPGQLHQPVVGFLLPFVLGGRWAQIVYSPELGLQVPIEPFLGILILDIVLLAVLALDLQQAAHVDVHLLLVVAFLIVHWGAAIVRRVVPHDYLIQFGQVYVLARIRVHAQNWLSWVLCLCRLAQLLHFLVLVPICIVRFWQPVRQVVQIFICPYGLKKLLMQLW